MASGLLGVEEAEVVHDSHLISMISNVITA